MHVLVEIQARPLSEWFLTQAGKGICRTVLRSVSSALQFLIKCGLLLLGCHNFVLVPQSLDEAHKPRWVVLFQVSIGDGLGQF